MLHAHYNRIWVEQEVRMILLEFVELIRKTWLDNSFGVRGVGSGRS